MDQEELDKYYDALITMFQSDGWRYLQEDYRESLESLLRHSDLDCLTNEAWHFRRGELNQLRNITSFEEFIRSANDERDRNAAL